MNRGPATLPRSGPGNNITWLVRPFSNSASWSEDVPDYTTGEESEGTYERLSWGVVSGSVQYGISYQYDPDTKLFTPPTSDEWLQLQISPVFTQPMGLGTSTSRPAYPGISRPAVFGETRKGLQLAYATRVNGAAIYRFFQINDADPGDPPNYVNRTLVGQADVMTFVRVGGYGAAFNGGTNSFYRSNAFGQLQMHLVIGMSVRTNGQWDLEGEDVSEENAGTGYGLDFPGANPPFTDSDTMRPLEDYNLGWVDIPIERGWSLNFPGFFSQGPV